VRQCAQGRQDVYPGLFPHRTPSAHLISRVCISVLLSHTSPFCVTFFQHIARGLDPQFRQKLEAIGFGVFIPVFFVTSGLQFDLPALLAGPTIILGAPVFLAALLAVRGQPALLYRPLVGTRRSMAAGLLHATSLSFIVAATQIGRELGLITKATGTALIAAGLLSVLIFSLLALTLLHRGDTDSPPVQKQGA
jgi:Kef-type K+ transport system membrane component KefB